MGTLPSPRTTMMTSMTSSDTRCSQAKGSTSMDLRELSEEVGRVALSRRTPSLISAL